jgi:imidazolonepropionase-like amidohydrolase
MMKRYRLVLLAMLVAALGAEARAQSGETLIRNATVMTASHGTIENASVLIRDGKIAAVGKDVKASPSAKVIDATGM